MAHVSANVDKSSPCGQMLCNRSPRGGVPLSGLEQHSGDQVARIEEHLTPGLSSVQSGPRQSCLAKRAGDTCRPEMAIPFANAFSALNSMHPKYFAATCIGPSEIWFSKTIGNPGNQSMSTLVFTLMIYENNCDESRTASVPGMFSLIGGSLEDCVKLSKSGRWR